MPYSNNWLFDQIASGKQFDYLYFWGHRPSRDGSVNQSCLSQWYAAGFEYEGNYFSTAEHWMMWHKALTFGDEAAAAAVLETQDPREVKSWGRKVKDYDDAIWAEVKYSIVVQGNLSKFGQNRNLKKYLLNTGRAILVEASPYDVQWGIGMTAKEARTLNDPSKWRGTNLLGWALMEVRDHLAKKKVYFKNINL
ncbi:MAG: NADAR family protein [Bacteroidota bacterium]